MRVKMTFAVLALAALALTLPASSAAGSRTVHVDPGESIQAAINQASPGTTIKLDEGTYAGSLLIDKDGIELVGEGRKKTKIVPPQTPAAGGECVDPEAPEPVFGICVFDLDDQGNPRSTVEDVEISHLSVDGFHEFGMFFIRTRHVEVTRTIVSGYGEYGIFANESTDTRLLRNVTYNDEPDTNPAPGTQLPEAGIYIGDAPNADATVWRNVAYGNLFGIFLRDAANGEVVKNKAFSNCIGILFLDTGAPVQVADWLAKHNNVTANSKKCEAFEGGEAPNLSGVGIGVVGGDDIDLIDNGVFGNKPAEGFESAFAGGIVVATSPFGPQLVPSTDVKVAFNTAIGNEPDLFWDEQGSGNAFFKNDCLTSQPDGLCEDSDENGDAEHGDDDGDRGNGHAKGDRDDRDDKRKHAEHRKHKKKHHKNKRHKKHDRDD